MSYAALTVYVEAYERPEQRMRLAVELAAASNAQLIGLSALAIPPPTVADGIVLADPIDVDIKLMAGDACREGSGLVFSRRGYLPLQGGE
jgi:hypothetical protein